MRLKWVVEESMQREERAQDSVTGEGPIAGLCHLVESHGR